MDSSAARTISTNEVSEVWQDSKESSARPRSKSGSLAKIPHNALQMFSIALHWFEVGVAGLCVVFVGLGVGHMIGDIGHLSELIGSDLHHEFEELLSNILLLVVGIELAIMLVRRTPESLVEVMFFVIARKMLIKTHNVYELLIGVAALAGLFAIRKYLEHRPPARQRLLHPDKPVEK